jgi:hypothetical protein
VSWSIRAEGTADEIWAQVHEHEVRHWRHMSFAERLAVHHLVGHAIEVAKEWSRSSGRPDKQFFLSGGGHQYDGQFRVVLSLSPVPDQLVQSNTTGPGSLVQSNTTG